MAPNAFFLTVTLITASIHLVVRSEDKLSDLCQDEEISKKCNPPAGRCRSLVNYNATVCVCNPGCNRKGEYCDVPIYHPCDEGNPDSCGVHGKCMASLKTSYCSPPARCSCSPPWHGDRCELNRAQCYSCKPDDFKCFAKSKACNGNGVCTKKGEGVESDFVCECYHHLGTMKDTKTCLLDLGGFSLKSDVSMPSRSQLLFLSAEFLLIGLVISCLIVAWTVCREAIECGKCGCRRDRELADIVIHQSERVQKHRKSDRSRMREKMKPNKAPRNACLAMPFGR